MRIEVPEEPGGHLVDNLIAFARFLRRADMVVGPGQVVDAARALQLVGVRHKRDVYGALFAVFVSRADQVEVFDLGFRTFWRDPFAVNRALAMLVPPEMAREDAPKALPRRIREAWQGPGRAERKVTPQTERDERGTASDTERLRRKDFEQMTAEELAEARRALLRLRLPWRKVRTRRVRASSRGSRLSLRHTVQRSLRTFGEPVELVRREPVTRHPPLVVLLDISGSMQRYSRMLLAFLHTLTNDRDRVHVFVFGTRLTNITRALRTRDPDRAMDAVSAEVADFAGGTRIGACLQEFDRHWSRRVLGQSAVVLLVTDGLERAEDGLLADAAERLQRSARRLIWLNPLLRYEGFEPRAAGIAALLPHVDEFRSCHSLDSLQELVEVLGAQSTGRSPRRT